MASIGLRREEGIGLAVAVALHVAVLAALLIRPPHHAVVTPPQRIEVTISDEVSTTSTSPEPRSEAAPDSGPQLGQTAPEPVPVPQIEPAPAPLLPQPRPRVLKQPQPRPMPRPAPAPKPIPKAVQRPQPATRAPSKPAPAHRSSAIDAIVGKPSRPTAAASSSKGATVPKKSGSTSFADAFKTGVPGAKSESGKGTPAAQMGPQVRSALSAAITRQLKPHWNPPDGADADQLVTILSFNLNQDGSLAGKPQVVRQLGITPANSAQASRHAEQAIRAVQLASPFNLPPEYYDAWKRVSSFRFDLRLSQ